MEQQPTSFTLTTYTLREVFDTPELITSLATYSESRQASLLPDPGLDRRRVASDPDSLLLLRVFAAADYFTTNKTLMQNVPPVNVDLSEPDFFSRNSGELITLTVLDPFLLNVLPRSLLPTGVYLIVLAVFAWYLSGHIWQGLYQISRTREEQHASRDASAAGERSKKAD